VQAWEPAWNYWLGDVQAWDPVWNYWLGGCAGLGASLELLVRGMCRPGSQPGNFEEEKNVLPQPGIKLQSCGCTASGSVITLIGPAGEQQKHKLYKQQVSISGTWNVTLF